MKISRKLILINPCTWKCLRFIVNSIYYFHSAKIPIMRTFFILLILFSASGLHSQVTEKNIYDEQLLKLYEGLRVSDVCDGMDLIGLHDQGLLDPSIDALWKDPDKFSHRMTGIAVTVRYVPTNRTFPSSLPKKEYEKWRDDWYTVISPEPFVDLIKPGSVVVIDNQGDNDAGTTGSNNSMLW